MALLIPDEKCIMEQHKNFHQVLKNATGYHPGPVAPSAAAPASLSKLFCTFLVSNLMYSVFFVQYPQVTKSELIQQRLSLRRLRLAFQTVTHQIRFVVSWVAKKGSGLRMREGQRNTKILLRRRRNIRPPENDEKMVN